MRVFLLFGRRGMEGAEEGEGEVTEGQDGTGPILPSVASHGGWVLSLRGRQLKPSGREVPDRIGPRNAAAVLRNHSSTGSGRSRSTTLATLSPGCRVAWGSRGLLAAGDSTGQRLWLQAA